MTTILTCGDLLTLLDPGACLDALREGFAGDAGGSAIAGQRIRTDLPGRTDPDQITVYGPVGLPWQDLALSLLAWREAGRRGGGTEIDFLAGP
ncbi:hypothetical protein ACI2LC_03450 [Nonomuraea wenchangensis]|uniref:hypothetical protein n=1 Tax=Nonomuraea wenchangensis TaxID=568860 RepID=UPI00384C89FA